MKHRLLPDLAWMVICLFLMSLAIYRDKKNEKEKQFLKKELRECIDERYALRDSLNKWNDLHWRVVQGAKKIIK